jgi:hypothetical protein
MATTYRKIGKKINRKKGEGGAEFNHVVSYGCGILWLKFPLLSHVN